MLNVYTGGAYQSKQNSTTHCLEDKQRRFRLPELKIRGNGVLGYLVLLFEAATSEKRG